MSTFSFTLSDLGPTKFNPESYVLNEELRDAVNVSIALNQPLLLTGEPGTGKTALAYKVAAELNKQDKTFLPEPLIFHAKTTSSSQDLFYTYDAIRHFYDANQKNTQAPNVLRYITLQALGKAIALTWADQVEVRRLFGLQAETARNSVVLIDEIDKAPRDFPNDILNEIESYEFQIKELQQLLIKKNEKCRIIVLMTSNSEKNLPEAFLRRCTFFNISFPRKEQLEEIVFNQLYSESKGTSLTLGQISAAITEFMEIRRTSIRKPPATAELISWIKILELHNFFSKGADPASFDFGSIDVRQAKILQASFSVLAKTPEDLQALRARFAKNFTATRK